MTHKEIAERLRKLSHYGARTMAAVEELQALADELDTPRPAPGTVVWWRTDRAANWRLGEVWGGGVQTFGDNATVRWHAIEWKPARIATPTQAIVDVPPVCEWGGISVLRVQVRSPQSGITFSDRVITRAEAEKMEAER